MPVRLEVNGETHVLDVPATRRLLHVLRGVLRVETFLILLVIGAGFGAAGWSVLVTG